MIERPPLLRHFRFRLVTDLSAHLVVHVMVLLMFVSIVCGTQSAVAAAKDRAGVDANLRCEQIAAGAGQIEGPTDSDGENLKLSSSRTWPSSFVIHEIEVVKSLARLKLDKENTMLNGLNSILGRALKYDYQAKYREVMSTPSKIIRIFQNRIWMRY